MFKMADHERSWLFTATLVLAVGILGDSGLTLQDICKDSIQNLNYFGTVDPHARQYSVIAHSLLKITTIHAKKRDQQLRMQRKQASSELFGLLPNLAAVPPSSQAGPNQTQVSSSSEPVLPTSMNQGPSLPVSAPESFDWTIYDADFFALPWPIENDQGLQDFLQPGTHGLDGASVADIPLFPIYDQGHVR